MHSIVSQVVAKAKDLWLSGLLASVAAVVIALHERLSAAIQSTFSPDRISGFVVIAAALVLLALCWVAYLYLRLSGRINATDYEVYHPHVGVSVYRMRESDPKFDFDIWYCPRCLTIDHKLAFLNLRHDQPGVWECVQCKLSVHPVSRREQT